MLLTCDGHLNGNHWIENAYATQNEHQDVLEGLNDVLIPPLAGKMSLA
jgi:hypothetical protein